MEDIKIISSESLGVRGLCTVVETKNRKIIIDPGIALGYHRHGLLPHPAQIAVDEIIREKIIRHMEDSTDIVFSHYHGDHVPLVEANPYQLSIEKVKKALFRSEIWAKGFENDSHKMQQRAWNLIFNSNKFKEAEGKDDGIIHCSFAVPHGKKDSHLGTVMMTQIRLKSKVFIHASDIQFLFDKTIDEIIKLGADIVLASGPPLYLSHIGEEILAIAEKNIKRLSSKVETLIIDHHLLRSERGFEWLRKINKEVNNRIITSADYMGLKPQLLEAKREELYEVMPVPDSWHEDYKNNRVKTREYLLNARELLDFFVY